MLKVRAGVLLGCCFFFFLSPFLLLFLPPQDYGNADAANQHYLREGNAPTTESAKRRGRGRREEDAERPMKGGGKKKTTKFHSAIHSSNTRAGLNDSFSSRQDFKL